MGHLARSLPRAAGRPVRVTLDTSRLRSTADAPRPTQIDDPAVRNDPLVRRAAELLDATVIAVTPRFAVETESADPATDSDAHAAHADRQVAGGGASDGVPAAEWAADEAPVHFDTSLEPIDEPYE